MNVIWHNHVASKTDSSMLALLREMNQRIVRPGICKKLPALMRVEGNKIQRWVVPSEDVMQSRWSFWHGALAMLMKSSPENIDYVLHLAYAQPKGDCEKRYCPKCNRDKQCG